MLIIFIKDPRTKLIIFGAFFFLTKNENYRNILFTIIFESMLIFYTQFNNLFVIGNIINEIDILNTKKYVFESE